MNHQKEQSREPKRTSNVGSDAVNTEWGTQRGPNKSGKTKGERLQGKKKGEEKRRGKKCLLASSKT